MRSLMDEADEYRVRAFAALSADNLAEEITRVLAGSDPPLLRAMWEACGIDERLRDFGRGLRVETHERLAAAVARARQARNIRRPALDASTAAWATLRMGAAATDPAGTDEIPKGIEGPACGGMRGVERGR